MAAYKIPAQIRKLVALRPSTHFRDVVQLVSVPTPKPGDGEVLIRNRYTVKDCIMV